MAFAGALLAVAPSFAGTITGYGDYTSWSGSVDNTSLTNINFDCPSCTNANVQSYSYNTNGAVFTGSGGYNFTGIYWANYPSYGGTVLMGGLPSGTVASTISVSLPANVTAFSVGFGLQNASNGGVVSVISGGQTIATVNVNTSQPMTFFGITSTANLSGLSFSSLNGNVVIDNVSYGAMQSVVNSGSGTTGGGTTDTSATPEATSVLLAGSGLVFLVVSQGLRKRSRAA